MTTDSWSDSMRKLPSKFDIDGLCKLLEIEQHDVSNHFIDEFLWAKDNAIKEGKTEEEAEEIGQQAECDACDEHFVKFKSAVLHTAEQLLDIHSMKLVGLKDGYRFEIAPKTTWEDAATAIKETINGYGSFYFKSTKEFLTSGPYTARQAVLSHLHWMKQYAAVYCDSSLNPANIFEREMQY